MASASLAALLDPFPSVKRCSWTDQVGKIRVFLERLQDMEDSHLETTLLRSCLSLPKFSYVLRTCPPSNICQATLSFDAAIREALESILGGTLSEWCRTKASLPSS